VSPFRITLRIKYEFPFARKEIFVTVYHTPCDEMQITGDELENLKMNKGKLNLTFIG